MVIRVTSSRGNKLISGKPLAFNELKKAVNEIMRGHIERDFIDTFCSIYGYKVLPYTEGYAAYYVDLKTRVVIVPSHSFPKEIDGAKVLYHTDREQFDPVFYAGGSIADTVSYLAICKYDNDNAFYCFHLNDDLAVVADDCFDSIEQCKNQTGDRAIVWHEKK